MERRDIFDAERRPMGYARAKNEPLEAGEFIVAVGIWIFNPKGEILFIQRDPSKRFAPLKWDGPAGHVSTGETSKQAAVRELREETGISATEDELIFLGTSIVPPYFGDNYCLFRNIPAASVTLQEGETCAAKWISYEEMLGMVDTGDISPSTMVHHAFFKDEFVRQMERAKEQ